MKLELNYLSPYLPYGLKGEYIDIKGCIVEMAVHTSNGSNTRDIDCFLNGIKPILRPLRDLNKREYSEVLENWEYIIDKELTSEIMWYEWECLFEWHFDVFRLIDKGLAIDINTLKI